MKNIDLRVYVITTCVPSLGRTHENVAAAALAGGATVIQFRDKALNDREFRDTAIRLAAIAHARKVPFIVNDRVDIAVAIGADGIHVGRNDADIAGVRKSLPAEMILGVSATNYEEAVAFENSGADYLGVGPVFPTVSKDDATPAIGTEELARICRTVRRPVVAIGGIDCCNLGEIIRAGAHGAAVISAVAGAADMIRATAGLTRLWERLREGGQKSPL